MLSEEISLLHLEELLGQISYILEKSKYDNYVIFQQFTISSIIKKDLVDPIYFTYYFYTDEGKKGF